MKKHAIIAITILFLGHAALASDLPKSLPILKVKQEKIIKKESNTNEKVVLPVYAQNTENRSLAGSEQIVLVSDPLFEMKTQKFGD